MLWARGPKEVQKMRDTTILVKPAERQPSLLPHPAAQTPTHFQIPAVLETSGPAPQRVLDTLTYCGETSKVGALTRCQQELRIGHALEQRIWIALSLCSAVTILYALYAFF